MRSLAFTLPRLTLRLWLGVAAALLATAPALAQGVTVSMNPSFPVARVPLDVSVSFGEPVQSVTVFVRPLGSSAAFREVALTDQGDGLGFSGRVPGEVVQLQGFEGYARYVRGGATFTEPQGAPQAGTARFPVLVPRVGAGIALTPRVYRMVAIPLQFYPELGTAFTAGTLDDVFGDDYGPYDPVRWRVHRWDPTLNTYSEADAAVPQVRPGEAFWLATSDGAPFDVEGGATPGFRRDGVRLVQEDVRVTLLPGWNQIGSPFATELPWSAVEGRTPQVSAPVAFGPGGYEPLQAELRPWEGYFVENRGGTPVTLTFRPLTGGTPARDGRPLAERYLDGLGAGGYLVQLAVEGPGGQDLHTYVGLATAAGDHDLAKPPPVSGAPRLAVEAEGQAWAGRILAVGAPPEWTLVHAAAPEPLALTLTEHGARPPGATPVLRDAASGAVLAVGTGTVTLPAGAGRLHLALVPDAEAPALPADRWLDAVYPNPARPDREPVAVRFWAPEGVPVALDVYDALGRRVAQLADAPGEGRWHALAWDGRDGAGRALPAGTYLLRFRAGEHALSRRLTLVR